jgi:hypothetical protein
MRPQMTISFRRVGALLATATLACGLTGCASINDRLAAGMGEYIPQWAGGLPADAPPRPGTAKYDEFMRERERKRQQPAAERDNADKTASTSPTSMAKSAPAR